MNKKRPLILASASPQRKKLLEEAGFEFEVIASLVDESLFQKDGVCACEYAQLLAKEKALDVARKHRNALVLGADSVVAIDDDIIGKPKDAIDAENIVRRLFAKDHKVVSGVAVISLANDICEVFCETTIIHPKKLSEEQILAHIKSGEWKGKAGGYGIQDCKDEFIDSIEGSFSNVIGLPMEATSEILKRLLSA